MKKAVVIGASSGIGRQMAIKLHREGYQLGITARRAETLEDLNATKLDGKAAIQKMDVTQTDAAIQQLDKLIEAMGGMDLIVISAGVGKSFSTGDWKLSEWMIGVNVVGFTAIADAAVRHFEKQGSGHLVGISSIAAVKGVGGSPVYSASKGYELRYLEGIKQYMRMEKIDVAVTAVLPGFVKTPLIEGSDYPFWVQPVEKACDQIYAAIRKRKFYAPVTKRWRLMAAVIGLMPRWAWFELVKHRKKNG